jgi:glycosyltransferase involved in cell wall biosynthesis
LFEGFGIPLLEAMHCEVPIITSNVSSLPEVAGDAALYCNPNEIDEIANAMMQLFDDRELCKDLVEKGILRKAHFSWDTTASLLWNSCEKTLNLNASC